MYILESIQEICFAQMVKKADIKLPKILLGFFKLLFYVVLKYILLNIELNSKDLPKMNLWLLSEEMHIP